MMSAVLVIIMRGLLVVDADVHRSCSVCHYALMSLPMCPISGSERGCTRRKFVDPELAHISKSRKVLVPQYENLQLLKLPNDDCRTHFALCAASFGIHASPYMGTISLTQLFKPHADGFTIGALLITYTILGGSLL